MPFEHLIFLILFVLLVATVGNFVANWRLQSTVRVMARLLASRSYTDYAVGEKKLVTPVQKPKAAAEPDHGYESAWNTDETK